MNEKERIALLICNACGQPFKCNEYDGKPCTHANRIAEALLANVIGDVTAEKARADKAERALELVIATLRYEFAGKQKIKSAFEEMVEDYKDINGAINKTKFYDYDIVEYFLQQAEKEEK